MCFINYLCLSLSVRFTFQLMLSCPHFTSFCVLYHDTYYRTQPFKLLYAIHYLLYLLPEFTTDSYVTNVIWYKMFVASWPKHKRNALQIVHFFKSAKSHWNFLLKVQQIHLKSINVDGRLIAFFTKVRSSNNFVPNSAAVLSVGAHLQNIKKVTCSNLFCIPL